MSLTARSREPEYFDAPERSPVETKKAYRQLRRLNRCFQFAHPFVLSLPRWLGAERCRQLEFLDLGAGDGLLGEMLAPWAARRGWEWRFTNLDLSPFALGLGGVGPKIAASVVALPFRDESFDVVVASQMTHHLERDADVVRHFQEAWRVSRDALFISDLHRCPALLLVVWCGTRLLGCSAQLRADAVTSVRRGFKAAEWRAWARQAGIPHGRVWTYLGLRLILMARKRGAAEPIASPNHA